MKQGRMGTSLGAVGFAAMLAVTASACADAVPPPPDGDVDWAKICITEPGRLRVDDRQCKEWGPADAQRTGYVWAYAQLPPSPTKSDCEIDPEDGVCYTYSYADTNDGDFSVIALGSFAGNNYYARPPSGSAGLRSASGLSLAGGNVTRSGAGTGTTSTSRVGSGTVSRGGLGSTGYSGSSGS